MGFNLLDMVKDQVGGQLVKHATGMLGESESGVTKALGGIFPSILGSMISKGSEEGGASKLFDMVKGVDPGIVGNIGGLLGGDNKPDALLDQGQGLLSSLMGNKLGGAVDMISKLGGIKSGSAMSLFKMAAPFLTGIIGKKVASDGLGLDGFTSMLNDQKESVSNALPAGMGSLMGLGGILGSVKDMAAGAMGAGKDLATGAVGAGKDLATGAVGAGKDLATGAIGATKDVAGGAVKAVGSVAGKAAGTVGSAAAGTAAVAKSAGTNIWKYLIPVLLIAGIAYLLSQTMCKDSALSDAMDKTTEMTKDAGGALVDGAKAAGGAVVDGAGAVGDAVVDGAGAVGSGISKAFGNVNEAAKSALGKITFAAGSAGTQMMEYIEGDGSGAGKFRFNNLNFNSGSAVIAGTSGTEVDNLGAILKAYPDVKVVIEGHTDSDGEEASNMTLSEGRAMAVKNRLAAMGIAEGRISTKGYGESKPVASNDTAEGKAENRRIEVLLVD